ncbi:MAG: YicC family protein [Rhodospirillales bacterium]|nr:YicC family protein [Rhodospirillales bacterium]
MTGFARAEGSHGDLAFAWELKSVNGKGLELRFRLPPGYDALEPSLRGALAQRFKRGNITASLTFTRSAGAAPVRINREALAEIVAVMNEIGAELAVAPPRLDGLLALRGVLESVEAEEDEATREARSAAVLAVWEEALDALAAMREAEGRRLEAFLDERLAEIAGLVTAAERSAAAQPEAIKARLRAMVEALLEASPALPEDRLAQEAALLLSRADVREELDRLNAHVAAARALLAEANNVGRRLDFLCQELNREANTLCSKSADLELTSIGLALKASIEQFREQVQNIE